MIINSYNFFKLIGGNLALLRQNTSNVRIDNSSGNNAQTIMTVNAGSMLLVIVHHMMLNGNNDTAIVSDNVQVTGYAQQCKSVCGSAGGSAKRGSVQIHASETFTSDPASLNGPTGDVKVFVKSNDSNIANIRMHYVIVEVANLQNTDIVATDFFACNTGTSNLGNNKPNVFISGMSQQNNFILAAFTGLQANQFSFNTCTYPASGWTALDITNEASGTATGNTRSMTMYKYGSSNVGTLIADAGTSYNSGPWAGIIAAFRTT